jgi:hypothetical protein
LEPHLFIFLNKELLLLKKEKEKERVWMTIWIRPYGYLMKIVNFVFVLTEMVGISRISMLTGTRYLSFYLGPNSSTFEFIPIIPAFLDQFWME